MNRIVALILLLGMLSCKRKSYVDYSLKFEKVADDCAEQQTYFRLNSNFGGERYEFEKCLPDHFSESKFTATRRGDTVLVRFPVPEPGQKAVVYHITLDIDSYPAYGFLTVNEDTYTLTKTEK
jgi:hypothetical protein